MQKPIREYDGKKLMARHLPPGMFAGFAAQVKSLDQLDALPLTEPWLLTSKLVVKPDMCAGCPRRPRPDGIPHHTTPPPPAR